MITFDTALFHDPALIDLVYCSFWQLLTANKISVQYLSSTKQQINIGGDELVTTVAHLAAKESDIAPRTVVQTKTRAKMRVNINLNSPAGQS